jgi:hypothetical protein
MKSACKFLYIALLYEGLFYFNILGAFELEIALIK